MCMELLESKLGNSSKTNSNKKKRWKSKKKLPEVNGSQIIDQACGNVGASEKLRDCKTIADNLEKNISETNLAEQSQLECPETIADSIESLPQVNTDAKQKKKRKRAKKVKSNNEIVSVDQNIVSMDQNIVGIVASKSLAEGNAGGKKRKKLRKKKKVKDETQSTDQADGMLNLHQELEVESINGGEALESKDSTREEFHLLDLVPDKETLSVCAETVELSNTVEGGNKNFSGSGKVMNGPTVESKNNGEELLPIEIQHGPPSNNFDGEHGNLSSGMNEVSTECIVQESELPTQKESSLSDLVPDKVNLLKSCKDEETIGLSHGVEDSSENISSILGVDRSDLPMEPMKVVTELVALESLHITSPNLMGGENEVCVSNNTAVEEETCEAENKEVECTEHVLGCDPRIVPSIVCIKRKLIVLDVNGLLADIVMPAPYDCTANAYILGRAIFKRPFCDDFLKFCFENFDVGIWSSRSKRIIDRVVDYLLGRLRGKLKFCWDMDHSTQTGFKTLENYHKPLVCKELRKIWANEDPNLRWKKGDYDESNTLLLDDSPYKALLNPLHTAIFPNSFHYHDFLDNSIAPGGDLRIYLEGLLRCDNVQKYVEQHPFGQSAINENNLSWGFYSGVLQTMMSRMENKTAMTMPMPYHL